MNYNEVADALVYDAAFWAMGFDDPDYPVEQLGKLALETGAKFRALGIYGLLATADKSHLLDNLKQAASLRIRFLEKVIAEKKTDDHHFVLGRVEPIFDLIASKNFSDLEKLVDLSPKQFRHPHEYLDDFSYAKILCHVALEKKDDTILPDLDALEEFLEEDLFSRAAMCRALLENNAQDFDEAFHNFIDQTEFSIQEKKAKGDLDEPILIAGRFISVEGLALLALAKLKGFKVNQNFLLCPLIAQ